MKKFLSVALVACMLLALLPSSAFAAGENVTYTYTFTANEFGTGSASMEVTNFIPDSEYTRSYYLPTPEEINSGEKDYYQEKAYTVTERFAPKGDDYKFSHWVDQYGAIHRSGEGCSPTEDRQFTAVYAKSPITVTFAPGDWAEGSLTQYQLDIGGQFPSPTDLGFTINDDRYEFWYWDSTTGAYNDWSDKVSSVVEGDTLTANYTLKYGENYYVTMDPGEGTGEPEKVEYSIDDLVADPSAWQLRTFASLGYTAPEGYKFSHWTVNGEGYYSDGEGFVSSYDTYTFTAAYVPGERYMVWFGAGDNGAYIDEDLSAQYWEVIPGTSITLPEPADINVQSAYETEFLGWEQTNPRTGVFQPGTEFTPTEDYTQFYALYEAPAATQHTLTFYAKEEYNSQWADDDVEAYRATVPAGESYHLIAPETAGMPIQPIDNDDSYYFVGWYDDDGNFYEHPGSTVSPTADMSFYAAYETDTSTEPEYISLEGDDTAYLVKKPGDTVTFTVTVSEGWEDRVGYLWHKDDQSMEDQTSATMTYVVTEDDLGQSLRFDCQVYELTNSENYTWCEYKYVDVTNATTDETPVITFPTSDDTYSASEDEYVTLQVRSPNATTYQWYKNGDSIPDAIESTYSFTFTADMDGDVYHCVVGNNSDETTNSPSTTIELYTDSGDTGESGTGNIIDVDGTVDEDGNVSFGDGTDIDISAILENDANSQGPRYTVEIVWGDMKFAWGFSEASGGEWDVETHTYLTVDGSEAYKTWYLVDDSALTAGGAGQVKYGWDDAAPAGENATDITNNHVLVINHSNEAVTCLARVEDSIANDNIVPTLTKEGNQIATSYEHAGYSWLRNDLLSGDNELGVVYSSTNATHVLWRIDMTLSEGTEPTGLNEKDYVTVGNIHITLSDILDY